MAAKRKGETSFRQTTFGIIPRSKLIPFEIEGIKKAWDFVLQKRRQGKIPINAATLKKIHSIGFGWIFPDIGGRFRTMDVRVSQHTPPKFYLVPQLMRDLCDDLRVRIAHLPDIDNKQFLESLIELLAWAHHRFLWVHPFADYNGRIGRLFINIILLNLDLPPIELQVETTSTRAEYVRSLQAADKGNGAALARIIRNAIQEAAAAFNNARKE